jgi:hypothetical protein
VDRQRDPALGDAREHHVVLGLHAQGAVRVTAHHDAADTGQVVHPLDLGDRALRAAVRQECEPGEAVGGVRHVLGEPVVVRAHERQVELGVGVREHGLAEPRCGVEHLGVDPVFVHLLEPRGRVVATPPDLTEPFPARHLFRWEPGARVHAERDGIGDSFEHPRVAELEGLDARSAVGVLLRHPGRPQIAGLVHVAVGRDEPVSGALSVGHAGSKLLSWFATN